MADSFNAYDHRSQENFASMERETKILVVNDTPDQLELVSALLRQAGYRLLAALDGL